MSKETSPFKIAVADSSAEIARCFPVMRQLRTHFEDEDEFVSQVQRQQEQGYRMAYLETNEGVCAVAGYRLVESLYSGRFLYVDELVTDANGRSLGHGGALLDWLVAEARAAGCANLELDSGVQRFAAHRFYLLKRMSIVSHHFSLEL